MVNINNFYQKKPHVEAVISKIMNCSDELAKKLMLFNKSMQIILEGDMEKGTLYSKCLYNKLPYYVSL